MGKQVLTETTRGIVESNLTRGRGRRSAVNRAFDRARRTGRIARTRAGRAANAIRSVNRERGGRGNPYQ